MPINLETIVRNTLRIPTLPSPACPCGKPAIWHGNRNGTRVFCCNDCWLDMLNSNPTLRDEQTDI